MAILIENFTNNPKQSFRYKLPWKNNPNEYVIIKFQWMIDLEYWIVGYEYHFQAWDITQKKKVDQVKSANGYFLNLTKGLFGDNSIPFDLFITDSGSDVGGRLINDLSTQRLQVYIVSHDEINGFFNNLHQKSIDRIIQLKDLKIKLGGLKYTLSLVENNETKIKLQEEINKTQMEIDYIKDVNSRPNNLLRLELQSGV